MATTTGRTVRLAGGAGLLLAVLLGGGLASPPVDAAQECFGKTATIDDHKGAIVGTNGNDVIIGDSGVNTIDGKGGNDRICARGDDDLVQGGSGNDRISGGNGDDDKLYGDKGDEDIFGGSGDDLLVGGDDGIGETLDGGTGTDFCTTDGEGLDTILLPC